MGSKKLSFILLFLVITGFRAAAQRDSIGLATIVTKTDKLAAEHPFEKVYLHFDKPYYAVGDTIWFKAYLTEGPGHRPSSISNIVYVDIINSRDSLLQSLKLPVANGAGNGDIALLPQQFRQGTYHVRAYTNWMRNFSIDYFFNKAISIGSAIENTVSPKITFTKTPKSADQVISAKVLYKDREGNVYPEKKVSWTVEYGGETAGKGRGITDKKGYLALSFTGNKLGGADDVSLITVIDLGKRSVTNTFPVKSVFAAADVQFFPEGGELIEGMRSKVAFKAVGTDGLGSDVTGKVTDNAGNEVADITSAHAGMGIFALLPEAGKSYKAMVKFADGSTTSYDLPKVLSDGISLAVNNNDPDNLTIKVATNAAYFKEYRNKGFYIVAQSGGVIYYTTLAALQSLVYTAPVPKSKFPTGVLQVTLFAANGDPLSERMVFIQHNDALNLALKSDFQAYKPFQHVNIALNAKSAATPVMGNFSVSVIDETKVPYDGDKETTILTSLLLTSDLRGYIEKPNYYFNAADSKRLADLDILMLTQGYRRFSYSDLLEGKYPPLTYLPEQGFNITGTLRTGNGIPVYKGIVNMLLPDRNYSIRSETDADGHFKFTNLALFDSSRAVLTAGSSNGSNDLMIMADVPAVQPVTKSYNDPGETGDIDSALSVYLQNSKKQYEGKHVLKEVVIKSTKTNTRVVHQDYKALVGLPMSPDQSLGEDMFKNCSSNFEGCVLGKIFGLWHREGRYYIKKDYDAGNMKEVKFFVDGLGVDGGYLDNINPADVESMEVYLKDGISGVMKFYDCNGIISITTKTHTLRPNYDKPVDMSLLPSTLTGVVTLHPKGFYKSKEFYSPKYNSQTNLQEINDLRSTIYWNPGVTTDKAGNAAFDFYNAVRGDYRIVIEGMDRDGNIGRSVLKYEVR